MSGTGIVRHTVLRLLKRFNPGTIGVRHHWTGDPVRLDCFAHRTYWYNGKRRERHLMDWFAQVIRPGDHVLELGGHIGYLSLYFASLVGETGRVTVYEPAPNNLTYIRQNLAGKRNVELRERAVGDAPGTLPMFIESLSGQNNSFVPDFKLLDGNASYSGVKPTVKTVEIPVVRVDDDLPTDRRVDFVKIDIEGFEYEALLGMRGILERCRPILLVEVNGRKNDETIALLRGLGYDGFDEAWAPLPALPADVAANTLWLHPAKHGEALARTRAHASAHAGARANAG